ncbi:MAG: LysM peptidoglycan-binding domain-containing protein [Cytophagaceae bacterium]
MKNIITLFGLLLPCLLWSQVHKIPEVPEKVYIGGLELTFTHAAKKKIEADIQMIYANSKYLQQKIDRANLYFPIVERVFSEADFPEEIKYLSLQESSLTSDAVSSSNAVGFWQFKKESAIEVGVQVNDLVDERKHIVYSSRGAAAYLKRNNALLKNWVYAILSYNLGAGGVKPHVKQKYVGASSMLIEEDMHWYVLRFIAHKIAYDPLVGKSDHPELVLVELSGIKDKTFADISKQNKVEETLLREYNKWCNKDKVPHDKEYIVMLPLSKSNQQQIATIKNQTPTTTKDSVHVLIQPVKFPDISVFKDSSSIPIFVLINGVKSIRVQKNDDLNSLIVKSGLKRSSFLYFNEMGGFEAVNSGEFYYLQLKRKKALVREHVVQPNETLWSIAQKYAVTTASIRSKNRMTKQEQLRVGRVLLLRDKRAKDQPVEYRVIPKPMPKVPPRDTVVIKKDTTAIIKAIEPPVYSLDKTQNVYHTVKPGETVFAISRMYQIDSDSIRVWNQLDGYNIKVGQELIVGKKVVSENKPTVKTHIVEQGQTLYQISKLYQTTPEKIMEWNHLANTSIKPGQELVIRE